MILALDFPGIDEIVKFPPWFGSGLLAFNKVAFIAFLAAAATIAIFVIGGSKKRLVPAGVQNVAEASIDFIREGVVLQAMGAGRENLAWTPYLTCIFFFILFANITEVIPVLQMPATARMAIPMILSLITWVLFVGAGIIKQGPRYFKEALFPPGVPKALYILVVPIEFLSTFIVRPFSLAIRLFANLLAGHILLVTFAVLGGALFTSGVVVLKPLGLLPMVIFVALTFFEVFVAVLQAYIFTILTAVYIGGAMHPEH